MKTKIYIISVSLILILLTIIAGYFTHTVFFYLLSIYGLIVLIKLFFQMFYSHINNKINIPKFDEDYTPKVSVIIPFYNETIKVLNLCVSSIIYQKYKGDIEVFLINDGSKGDYGILNNLTKKLAENRELFYFSQENKGKRFAQKIGFDRANGDIIITVDSDTILKGDAVSQIVQNFRDKDTGAVTGDVKVYNGKINILTRLLDARYWFAFNQERASHSLFGAVTCCSGPFSAYRAALIKKLKEKYISQKFFGNICHFGDDRHLTNLVLTEGYKVYYNPKAVVHTFVPEKISEWLKQQLRWNKSFYREIFWNIPAINKHHPYMAVELFLNSVLPLFLVLNISLLFYKGFFISFLYFLLYLVMILIASLIRVDYCVYKSGQNRFSIFVLYSFLHIFLLIPVRLLAIITLPINRWGTR